MDYDDEAKTLSITDEGRKYVEEKYSGKRG